MFTFMYTISTTFFPLLHGEDADDFGPGVPGEPLAVPAGGGTQEDPLRRDASRGTGRADHSREAEEEDAEAVKRRVAPGDSSGGGADGQGRVPHIRRTPTAFGSRPIVLQWFRASEEELKRLPVTIKDRIVAKMEWFCLQKNPLQFAKRLSGLYTGRWRFRIGEFRVICRVTEGDTRILQVLAVKNRKDAYRGL